MAVELKTKVVETKTVSQVQITGFAIDYENLELTSSYMTLLDDGTPYQRGQATTTDVGKITALMDGIEADVLDGTTLEEASAKAAYDFVLAKLDN